MKKISILRGISLFMLLAAVCLDNAYAAKIFGFGSNEYDVVFRGTPISVREMKPGEPVDAVEGPLEDTGPRQLVVFKIERVMMGEFAKQRRGGPSRFDQMSKAIKDKEALDLVSFNFKNPADMLDRDKIRIAVKDSGATFGLTPGQEMAYFEHKIYLKRISSSPEAFMFVKSVPVKAAPRPE